MNCHLCDDEIDAGYGDDDKDQPEIFVCETCRSVRFQNIIIAQQERIAHLENALQTTLYQCVYWLKTYRSHTGSMNATHISEQESLERAIKIAKDALSETTQT